MKVYLLQQIIMTLNVSWQNQKKSLFSHSDPTRAIQSMKSVNTHLQQTQRITTIKAGVSNTSGNLIDTNSMYNEYDEKLKKAQIYIIQLKKKEAANARKIKMAFWFLIITVIYIAIRRILFPGLYRWT